MPKQMSSKDRSFEVVKASFGGSGGRYVSQEPMDAARKAAKMRFNKDSSKRESLKIAVQEITRGGDDGIYYYNAKSVKIPAKKYTFKGRTFTVTHKTEVTAMSEAEKKAFQ